MQEYEDLKTAVKELFNRLTYEEQQQIIEIVKKMLSNKQ
jgi:uncharacterized protein YoaH (UPF0181 family)